ncbi:hypothetical protein [Plantactinospora veratri]
MTGGQFREVDLDLLADYVGGALHGTPDETEIARLVDQDPAWAEAYAALTAGLDAVRLDLAAWAAEPTPMPSPVLDRLVTALAGAAAPDSTGPSTGTSPTETAGAPAKPATEPGQDSTEPVEALGVPATLAEAPAPGAASRPGVTADSGSGPASGSAPGGPRRPAGRPRRQQSAEPTRAGGTQRPGTTGRRRRWARRMAAPLLLATVIAGFAGFALSGLVNGGDSAGDQSAGTALNSGEDSAAPQILGSGPPRTVVEPSAERVLSTGTDYTPDSLPDTVSDLARQAVPTTAPPGRHRGSAAPARYARTPARERRAAARTGRRPPRRAACR